MPVGVDFTPEIPVGGLAVPLLKMLNPDQLVPSKKPISGDSIRILTGHGMIIRAEVVPIANPVPNGYELSPIQGIN